MNRIEDLNEYLYFAPGDTNREELLKDFGKHTTGKAGVNINKVADIDVNIFKKR
ncbi:hypothetical protein GCM10020331_053200 [Ectobacillus funiculus]